MKRTKKITLFSVLIAFFSVFAFAWLFRQDKTNTVSQDPLISSDQNLPPDLPQVTEKDELHSRIFNKVICDCSLYDTDESQNLRIKLTDIIFEMATKHGRLDKCKIDQLLGWGAFKFVISDNSSYFEIDPRISGPFDGSYSSQRMEVIVKRSVLEANLGSYRNRLITTLSHELSHALDAYNNLIHNRYMLKDKNGTPYPFSNNYGTSLRIFSNGTMRLDEKSAEDYTNTSNMFYDDINNIEKLRNQSEDFESKNIMTNKLKKFISNVREFQYQKTEKFTSVPGFYLPKSFYQYYELKADFYHHKSGKGYPRDFVDGSMKFASKISVKKDSKGSAEAFYFLTDEDDVTEFSRAKDLILNILALYHSIVTHEERIRFPNEFSAHMEQLFSRYDERLAKRVLPNFFKNKISRAHKDYEHCLTEIIREPVKKIV